MTLSRSKLKHMQAYLLAVFLLFIFVTNTCRAHDGRGRGHSHHHSHDSPESHHHHHDHEHHGHHEHKEEKPWLKYSQEMNEPIPHQEQDEDLDHIDESHRPSSGQKWTRDSPSDSHAPREQSKFHEKYQTATPPEMGLGAILSALLSTIAISVAPIALMWLIPVDNSAEYEPFLKVCLGFAAGSLLGDAFLHLLPHATSESESRADHRHVHSHEHGHSHADSSHVHSHDLSTGVWTVSAIVVFCLIEIFVRTVKGSHHHHGHGRQPDLSAAREAKKKVKKSDDDATLAAGDSPRKRASAAEHSQSVSAYLNLLADFVHNFTDGLAIGASYQVSNRVGFVTTATILFHEIPHEIGDIAILIQAGCSKKQAIGLQIITAVGAILGTLIGLCFEGSDGMGSSWILPFTAGGFIYIATVSIIPEILQESKLGALLMRVLAMVFGLALMGLIAMME